MRLALKRGGGALPWSDCCWRRKRCRTSVSSGRHWPRSGLGLPLWLPVVEGEGEEEVEECSSPCLLGEGHMPWCTMEWNLWVQGGLKMGLQYPVVDYRALAKAQIVRTKKVSRGLNSIR